MRARLIAIVGPNEADDEACRHAYDAGAQVAGRGDVGVTGGPGGVMAAASRGGSWGPLSEIALARRTGVPVVAVCGWNVTDQSGAPVSLDTAPSAAEAVQAVYRAFEHDTNRVPDD